jgi:hypothetical protein
LLLLLLSNNLARCEGRFVAAALARQFVAAAAAVAVAEGFEILPYEKLLCGAVWYAVVKLQAHDEMRHK